MKAKEYKKINIYELEELYSPSFDIFSEDDETYDKLKRIISFKLNETERRIILCYADVGNLRDTAKIFNVSTSTIWAYVTRIKTKIMKFYKEK